MVDLSSILPLLLLLCMAYLVGLAAATLLGKAWQWIRDRRWQRTMDKRAAQQKPTPQSPAGTFSDLPILRHYGMNWTEWEELTDSERRYARDQFFRSHGL